MPCARDVCLLQAVADEQIVRHHILLGHPGDWVPKGVFKAVRSWGHGRRLYRGMNGVAGNQHTDDDGLPVEKVGRGLAPGEVASLGGTLVQEGVSPMLRRAEDGVREAKGRVAEVGQTLDPKTLDRQP